MKRCFPLIFLGFFVFTGCVRESDEYVDLSGSFWSVSGALRSSDGKGLGGHRVEIVKIQPASKGGGYEGRIFAVVKTDSAGEFYFATPVPGVFDVAVKGKYPCMKNVPLGEMRSGEKRVEIVLQDKGCALII